MSIISISTYGTLIVFGKWIKGVNLKGTIWEKLIVNWLDFKYDLKKKIGLIK